MYEMYMIPFFICNTRMYFLKIITEKDVKTEIKYE